MRRLTQSGSAAHRLTRNADGTVDGVRVRRVDGGAVSLTARSGVVLTTGGFSQSEDLLRTFAPAVADATKLGGTGSTGDGLLMAMALGARPVDMGYVEPTFGATGTDRPRLLFAHADGAVIVGRDGRRFADESLDYKTLGRLCAQQPGGTAFQIFDHRVLERSQTRPTPRDFRSALTDGLITEAPHRPRTRRTPRHRPRRPRRVPPTLRRTGPPRHRPGLRPARRPSGPRTRPARHPALLRLPLHRRADGDVLRTRRGRPAPGARRLRRRHPRAVRGGVRSSGGDGSRFVNGATL